MIQVISPPWKRKKSFPPLAKGGLGGFGAHITNISNPQFFYEVSIAKSSVYFPLSMKEVYLDCYIRK
jgi:hypothetical protein